MPIGTLITLGAGAVKGVTAITKYLNNRNRLKKYPKRPTFAGSGYDARLKELEQTGTFSPLAKQYILAKTSKTAEEVANRDRSSYYGRMLNMGQGGSLAAQSGLNQFDINKMELIGDTAKDIETENELSKVKYGLQRGQINYGDMLDKYGADVNKWNLGTMNTQDLIGGLGDTAGSLLSSWSDDQIRKELLKLLKGNRGEYV